MLTKDVDSQSLKLEISSMGFTDERREEVYDERQVSTPLHWIFPIMEKCGPVAYKLDILLSLASVHNIFHVSQLKKCLKVPSNIVLPELTPLEADLLYPEHPKRY
jgi:hypothetical protein